MKQLLQFKFGLTTPICTLISNHICSLTIISLRLWTNNDHISGRNFSSFRKHNIIRGFDSYTEHCFTWSSYKNYVWWTTYNCTNYIHESHRSMFWWLSWKSQTMMTLQMWVTFSVSHGQSCENRIVSIHVYVWVQLIFQLVEIYTYNSIDVGVSVKIPWSHCAWAKRMKCVSKNVFKISHSCTLRSTRFTTFLTAHVLSRDVHNMCNCTCFLKHACRGYHQKRVVCAQLHCRKLQIEWNTSSVPGLQYGRFPSQAATCPQRRQHLHCFRGRELCFFDVVHFPIRWCQKLGMCSHLFPVPRGFSIYNDRRDESGECMLRTDDILHHTGCTQTMFCGNGRLQAHVYNLHARILMIAFDSNCSSIASMHLLALSASSVFPCCAPPCQKRATLLLLNSNISCSLTTHFCPISGLPESVSLWLCNFCNAWCRTHDADVWTSSHASPNAF